jgi:hypothetical protein
MTRYLEVADKVLSEAQKGSRDVKTPLLKAFPEYKVPSLLDVSNSILFGNK